jgi:hypothetical protein
MIEVMPAPLYFVALIVMGVLVFWALRLLRGA